MTFEPGDDPEFGVDDSEFQSTGLTSAPDQDVESAEDFVPAPEPEYRTALPPKVEAWRKRSATGAILTGFALGLQEALETKHQEPAIVMQTSGDPPRDLPIEADFEYGRPRQSVVNIRPWLLDGATPERDAGEAGPSAGEAGPSAGEAGPSAGDGEAGREKP